MKFLFVTIALVIASLAAGDTPNTMQVFVALCDNKTQGIIPVGEKIGDGDKPDDNLYWGCSEALPSVFRRSRNWKVLNTENDVSSQVLRRMKLRHVRGGQELTVEAYRGSAMRQCLIDFEQAVASGRHDVVAYMGHNGLMDFDLPEAKPTRNNRTRVVVLCCLSERYFTPRLQKLGARPILLTRQLMYPASSVLHDVIETRNHGGSLKDIRMSAARAYATNQSISVKAAAGVFAVIEDESQLPQVKSSE
jgi:hypothetical protein